MSKRSLPSLAAFAAAMALVPAAAQAAEIETALVSRATGLAGAAATQQSNDASVSQDGRYVAFASLADNLSAADDDAHWNVYVRDRATGVTELVSRGLGGAAADGESENPRITPDGRYVVFDSKATNLVAGDANGPVRDVFVVDRLTGTTTLASRASGVDGATGTEGSFEASISADGTKVAFSSSADELSPIDDDSTVNVFVRDLAAGTTELVNQDGGVAGDGSSSDAEISGDGTDVAFGSSASNLDGGGNPGQYDVFVRDLVNGTTTLVSRPTGFGPEVGDDMSRNPTISHSGRYVAFESSATNLVGDDDDAVGWRVLRRDTLTGMTTLVSRATGANGAPNAHNAEQASISADGGTVAFRTATPFDAAAEPGVLSIYTRTIGAATTTLVSRESGPDGAGADADAHLPAISADGQAVAFQSMAENLSADDQAGVQDVFVRAQAIPAPVAPQPQPQPQPEPEPQPEAQPQPEVVAAPVPAATPQPPAVAPTTPKVRLRLVRLNGGKAKVRVRCLAGECVGVLRLQRPTGRRIGLGRARFSVPAGSRRTVTVRLRREVAKPKVRAKATLRPAGLPRTVVARTLRLPRG